MTHKHLPLKTQRLSNFWIWTFLAAYSRKHNQFHKFNYNFPQFCSGLWNVPYISSSYLIKRSVFNKFTYADDDLDADMAFCKSLRQQVKYAALPSTMQSILPFPNISSKFSCTSTTWATLVIW